MVGGWSLISAAMLFMVVFGYLAKAFNYPDVLDGQAADVLPKLLARRRAPRWATSQLALPKATCDLVYATTGYEQSITNLQQTSLATDKCSATARRSRLPSMSGDVNAGFIATLNVAV